MKKTLLWLFPAVVVVVSSAARAHVNRELSLTLSSGGLSAEWVRLFADLAAGASFLSAVVAWVMVVTLAHLMALLLGGRGAFGLTLRDAGYAFVPIAAASLFTALSIDTIVAEARGAYGTLNGLNSDQLRIALAGSSRLTLAHTINNASELVGLLFVSVAVYDKHQVSALKAVGAVFAPVALVYLVQLAVRAVSA
jgi:hypothetical protein